jgi:serine/threonine protein kinase
MNGAVIFFVARSAPPARWCLQTSAGSSISSRPDGATLFGVLQERGPLDLKEAQDIASQFLAGLEAIHKVGLVHRDIKPENIMLTRAGRVSPVPAGLW